MTLANRFITSLIGSILFIATVNVLAFYIFYSAYLQIYLAEKIASRSEVTIEYINEVLERQAVDEIESIFSDTDIEFFELLEINNGKIPLDEKNNIDTIINYLVENGVATEYIEEIVPTDTFGQVLEAIKNKNTPEYRFLNKLTLSIVLANVIAILIIIFGLQIFIRTTLLPIKQATEKIKGINPSKGFNTIEYHNKKDEVGLLITSINNLNKRLSLQEKIRTRLLADISHELKTPITSIQCYLEGISDGVIKLNQKNLNSITIEMERLTVLVNKIMDYEKFERTEIKIQKKSSEIYPLLTGVVETHKKRLKENKQRIKITGDNDLILEIDQDQFRQLAHNLIGNFLKYAGKNTILRIILNKNYIDFSDDGIGIKSSEIPFLTEKFYQGNIEKSGDIDERGIGIGLSITKKIIESHAWRYEVKSDNGEGFSFKVYVK